MLVLSYDALNRPTAKAYSNEPSGVTTPAVYYCYDSQSLPSGAPSFTRGYSTGRLVPVLYGGSTSTTGDYHGYDAAGRVLRKIQRLDSTDYLVEASYNVSAATSMTYPSVPGYSDRRAVTPSFDYIGRVQSLSSSATSYAAAASVSSVSYASHGAPASETYGNNNEN